MTDRTYKTPVKDLLAEIPPDLVIKWQDKDGLKASHNCPIGRIAQEAIAALEAAEPKPAEAAVAEDVEAWISKVASEWYIRTQDVRTFITTRDRQHEDSIKFIRYKLKVMGEDRQRLIEENRRLSDELKKADEAVEQVRADERAKVLKSLKHAESALEKEWLEERDEIAAAPIWERLELVRRLIESAPAAQEKT